MSNRISIIIILFSLHYHAQSQAVEGRLLSTWSDSTLVGSSAYNNTYNEIWGIATGEKEYAIIGTTAGTHFIDVTDPTNCSEEHFVAGRHQGREIIHRDYHDYNGYLYAVSDEGSGSTLQIIDLSYLPDSVSVVYDSQTLIRHSHNIFIDTSAAVMYACGTNGTQQSNTALRVFDISDPYEPRVIENYNRIDGFIFSTVHDAFVIQDTAYLNCGERGLLIADFSDPAAAISLGSLSPQDYPQFGYNHSGWLSSDRNTYCMGDESWGKDLKLLDVSELPEIRLIDTIDAGSSNIFTIPHNQVVHDNYLYSAYYYDGLQVWDISDPKNSERVIHYPTSSLTHRQSYEGAWGVYPFLPSGIILVSDMQEGLFVLDSPENTLTNTYDQNNKLDDTWEILPNPSSGYFEIKTSLLSSTYKLSLLDINGQLISQLDSSGSYQLQLASGTYLLRIIQGNFSSTKKLVVAAQ